MIAFLEAQRPYCRLETNIWIFVCANTQEGNEIVWRATGNKPFSPKKWEKKTKCSGVNHKIYIVVVQNWPGKPHFN